MQPSEARRVLGVGDGADADEIRLVYRQLLLRTHPDLSAAADAHELTARLTLAYRVLIDALAGRDQFAPTGSRPDGRTPAATPRPRPRSPEPELLDLSLGLVDDDTIGVGAPADETLHLLCETAHELGEITYLDATAGLIEVVVEFVEAPTSSIVFSLQGRATGVTDVFCTVEPLSGGAAPPSDAVTRLVLDTLSTVAVAHHRRPVSAPA